LPRSRQIDGYVLASSWRRAAHFDTPEGLVGTNVVSANVPN
jgi:hypothetical protein